MKKIAILMATYNGEQFLHEQIDSILNQSYKEWVLFIRDDNSSDKTQEIISYYVNKYPDKIVRVLDEYNLHGAKSNFYYLMRYVMHKDFDYFMFCDQDDFWIEDKIMITMQKMVGTESDFKDIPVLVHTDLMVVDSNLKALGDSFFDYRCLNHECKSINRILIQNNITGCTVMINKKLLMGIVGNEYLDINNIAMHDWWIALFASTFGRIEFVNKATIKYRQHGKNVVGATRVKSIKFIMNRLFSSNHVKETLEMSVEQAKQFLNTYEHNFSSHDKQLLKVYSSFSKYSKLKRLYYIFKYGIMKQGIIQVIGEIMFI